ncbi:protein capicua homolog [Hippopotamus amphibius kiboko]|uniref:protein capicua homolog n=1 Tax=Hippopotamus amphibius kiboko TaxID=575201 RepID=UPI0025936DB1|nr:protein capicua homolog [Hippopotamus amphibius kiboko]
MLVKQTLWNPWPRTSFEISVPKKVLSAFAGGRSNSPEALVEHSAGARKGRTRSLPDCPKRPSSKGGERGAGGGGKPVTWSLETALILHHNSKKSDPYSNRSSRIPSEEAGAQSSLRARRKARVSLLGRFGRPLVSAPQRARGASDASVLPAAPAHCPRPSQRGPERARRSHSPLLPRPRLTRLSRHPEPTKAAPRPDACLLPARLPSPDFGVSSTLGFGTRSPRSGGRAAAIAEQRRRPVAGACPSPHPAGNLGGALGRHRGTCGILVPRPGTEPTPPAVEEQNLNHWMAREVDSYYLIQQLYSLVCIPKSLKLTLTQKPEHGCL